MPSEKEINNKYGLIFVEENKRRDLKTCQTCGKSFMGSFKDTECVECVLNYEDGIFMDRDMNCGDR